MFPSEFLNDEECRWLEKYTNKCMFWLPDSKFECDYIGRKSQCSEFEQVKGGE